MLLGYLDVNGCVDDVHHICEQLAAHVPRESSERAALTSVRPVINDQHGFRGIGVGVWIAQRSVGLHGSDHTEPVQLHAIPTAGTNMPRQDGLIACQADLAIGKALTCIDVGAAALQVIAGDLRFCRSAEEKCKRDQEESFANHCSIPHWNSTARSPAESIYSRLHSSSVARPASIKTTLFSRDSRKGMQRFS